MLLDDFVFVWIVEKMAALCILDLGVPFFYIRNVLELGRASHT